MQKELQENKSDDGDFCSRSQTNNPKNVGVKKQNKTNKKQQQQQQNQSTVGNEITESV